MTITQSSAKSTRGHWQYALRYRQTYPFWSPSKQTEAYLGPGVLAERRGDAWRNPVWQDRLPTLANRRSEVGEMQDEIRGTRVEELPAVAALVNRVFRPNGGQMPVEYPLMFAP